MIRKRNNKRLYEYIIKDIAITIKKQLNENNLFDDIYAIEDEKNIDTEFARKCIDDIKYKYVPELNKDVTYLETEPTNNKTNYIKLIIVSGKTIKGNYIKQEDIKYILKTECPTYWSAKMEEFIYKFVRTFIKRNLKHIYVCYYDTDKNDWYYYIEIYNLNYIYLQLLSNVPENVKKNYKVFISREDY